MFLHPHTTKLIIFARKIAYIMKSIRKYPVSLFLIAAIWTVCLIPIPETPLNDVPMMDKWTHFVMFGVLSLCIISEYVYRHRKPKGWDVALVGMLLPFAMGGMIELAQAYCTGGNRSGDIMDWLADGIGVLIGAAIGSLLVYYRARARKDISACAYCRTCGHQ